MGDVGRESADITVHKADMNIIINNPYRQLGVYSNSPIKERVANHNRLKAFLKVGKQVDFPLDLPQYLSPIDRTSESVAQAEASLALPNEQLRYAQFWFMKDSPLDEVAFNHLFAGNMEGAIDIWTRKDCASSLQNRIVCALIKEDYSNAIACTERLYSQYAEQFVGIVIGAENGVSGGSLAFGFIDELCDAVGYHSILPFITDETWKNHLAEKSVNPLIEQIQSAIDVAKSSRGKGSTARYNAGVKLMKDTTESLQQLKTFLSTTDLQYQVIADKLGLEILQCGIDYYNDSDDNDAAYKAIELQKYAESIVVGKVAVERCKENVRILEDIISKLPPLEVMTNHKNIQLALAKFAIQPELIIYSIQLIKSCVSDIVAIKEASGNLSQVAEIAHLCKNNLHIYSGNDDQVLPVLSLGGLGVISVLSNVKPEYTHNMVQNFFDGNIEMATKMQLDALPLIKALFSEVNPIPVKAALNMQGYDFGIPRLPLTPMTEEKMRILKKELDSLK